MIHAWQQLALQEVLQQKKLYQELGLESFKSRHWFRKLCHFYKIYNEKSPLHLLKYLILIGFTKPGLATTFLQ